MPTKNYFNNALVPNGAVALLLVGVNQYLISISSYSITHTGMYVPLFMLLRLALLFMLLTYVMLFPMMFMDL